MCPPRSLIWRNTVRVAPNVLEGCVAYREISRPLNNKLIA